MTSNNVPDKVAVVIGASSGIGAATTRALAADGYRVALLARRLDRITTLDALINNAGVMLLGPFDSDQRADYRQMIEVNLLGAITTTEVFLDQLKDGGGDIINIKAEVTAADVAEIIAFILSRPRRLAINEILLRPAGQQ
jgi:NADP-dependent 3-hydroxy acid dehydrogenase YdfG